MISRTWHGIVPVEHENGFAEHLSQTDVKAALEIKGNLGVYVKKVVQEEYCHFFLCTIWESWQDVIRFAGEDPTTALTYADDEQYGLISDPIVIHQEVSNKDNPFTQGHS